MPVKILICVIILLLFTVVLPVHAVFSVANAVRKAWGGVWAVLAVVLVGSVFGFINFIIFSLLYGLWPVLIIWGAS